MLRKRGIEAFGVDKSKTAISKVPKRLKDYFFLGDVKSLGFEDRSFDVVSCIDLLEHIDRQSLEMAIKECARVAFRAVYFDITSKEDFLFVNSDPTHVTKLYSWQWKKILEDTLGFDWEVKRGFILPFIHHGIFVAKRRA